MISNREANLRDALQEHGAYWNVGSDRAWESGSDVLLGNDVFERLIALAANSTSVEVREFIDWLTPTPKETTDVP